MNAVLQPLPRFEPMTEGDIEPVLEIEQLIYEYPWTHGNFRDSLLAGYSGWVLRDGHGLIGYAMLMLGAGEAHLLNLSVAAPRERHGHGSRLLEHLIGVAREAGAKLMFLEVRPSNAAGRRLYARHGFREAALRRGYYPARGGHEDALLLALDL
jgi:ribosomal-protein-alanine N-acetyltransferase